jgi:NTE family protein
MTSDVKIGLALGAGAARGLAHITLLEAFDALGVKPAAIAGTSMGALIGAGYASGLDTKAIAAHAHAVLGKRVDAARRVLAAEGGGLFNLLSFNPFASPILDGLQLARLSLPSGVAARIEDTAIPLKIVATDFFGRCEVVLSKGPMVEAVAASIAIPGVIAGPEIEGRPVIDGGCVNPVPFDHVREGMDIVVAIDVIGGPVERGRIPNSPELLAGSLQIQQKQISALRRASNPPDIYIEPAVDQFRIHDFFRLREIVRAAEPARETLKRLLAEKIEARLKGRLAAE